MRGHVFTWAVAVLTSIAMGLAWVHFHPPLRMVRVDMSGLFEQQKKVLAERIKPGMSEQEQKALFQSAADFAGRVDGALVALSRECGCAVVNSAAILQVPAGKATGITDATGQVRELLGMEVASAAATTPNRN